MATLTSQEGRFRVPGATPSEVSWLLLETPNPNALLVFGHGAGADMRQASLVTIATELSRLGIAVLRFNFPFMESGKGPVGSRAVATATIAAAVAQARVLSGDLPLFVGGHSFGGRMASHAILEHDLGPLRGLIFCSFPLHTAGAPATSRAKHLRAIELPMLFLSGTRDALAEPELLRGVVDSIGPRAELVWLDTADHGYKTLKRSRTRTDSVFEELADAAAAFVTRVC